MGSGNIVGLYNVFVDFYIGNFRPISIILTLLIGICAIFIKAYKKNWQWEELLSLGSIISLILTCYSLPTSILLIVCCNNVSKLNNIAEISIYLIIAGVALLHTACSFIGKYGKDL